MDHSSVCVICKLCIHTSNIWLKQPPQITLVTLVSIKVPNSPRSQMLSLPAETTSPPYFSPLHLSSSSPKCKELLPLLFIYLLLNCFLLGSLFFSVPFEPKFSVVAMRKQNETNKYSIFLMLSLKKKKPGDFSFLRNFHVSSTLCPQKKIEQHKNFKHSFNSYCEACYKRET